MIKVFYLFLIFGDLAIKIILTILATWFIMAILVGLINYFEKK